MGRIRSTDVSPINWCKVLNFGITLTNESAVVILITKVFRSWVNWFAKKLEMSMILDPTHDDKDSFQTPQYHTREKNTMRVGLL